MKIGELAERTGVATRLIRYYEQQDLLRVERSENGYRQYSETDVERIERVAGLVRAGIPTRLVKVLLDVEDLADRDDIVCTRTVATMLVDELGGLEERIACLTRSRDTIREYVARTHGELLEPSIV
ncbi:MAG TPA: MerR family transcriptional regulator [Microbacterium sp.]|nr:MerR family transcriptional regulator [Microbacterium sp.]